MMVEHHVLVVETPEFRKQAKRLFASADVAAIRLFVAENPTAGDIMRGTGGVRKLRWALPGRGKRGGARVIYFYTTTPCRCFCSVPTESHGKIR